MSVRVKVMTFNIRVRVKNDGDNFQDNRKEKILSVIRSEAPDLIGFQEVQDLSMEWLAKELSEYTFLGYGRDAGYCGEFSPIAFRTDRFSLLGFDQRWLSFADRTPASRIEGLDQSHCPRIYTHADLLVKGTTKPFSFYNIHTDHQGALARIAECTLLLNDVAHGAYPFVMTGDFNACPDEAAITMITGSREVLGTVDLTAELGGTFHGFGKREPIKIDYIFSNLEADVKETYAIPDDDACGCYYSDHNAICAFVTVAD